jgi:hypothetical protein
MPATFAVRACIHEALRDMQDWFTCSGHFQIYVEYDPALVCQADLQLISQELRDANHTVSR